jgi:hypothetical protein
MAVLAALVLLHGTVMKGPTQPVCQVGKPCSAPAVGVTLVFSRRGHVVGRTRTVSGGRYAIRLAPGFYAVAVSPPMTIGRGLEPRSVTVRTVTTTRNFSLDTGIR